MLLVDGFGGRGVASEYAVKERCVFGIKIIPESFQAITGIGIHCFFVVVYTLTHTKHYQGIDAMGCMATSFPSN